MQVSTGIANVTEIELIGHIKKTRSLWILKVTAGSQQTGTSAYWLKGTIVECHGVLVLYQLIIALIKLPSRSKHSIDQSVKGSRMQRTFLEIMPSMTNMYQQM